MNLVYRKISKEEASKVRELINTVIGGLENPEFFIPYEEWEYEKMFDESYAPLYGAYDGDKLVAMGQLYVQQDMLQEYIKLLGLEGKKVCELGGALCLKEYRKQGIMTHIMGILEGYAKDNHFDYIITMAHPDNIASNQLIHKLGIEYVKTEVVHSGFLRKIYSKKI